MKMHSDYETFHRQLDSMAPVYPETPSLFDDPEDWKLPTQLRHAESPNRRYSCVWAGLRCEYIAVRSRQILASTRTITYTIRFKKAARRCDHGGLTFDRELLA